MKWIGFAILAVVMAHGVPASAEQWSKTYNLSGKPNLRVETSDANIQVTTWDQQTIEATIVSAHYKIGPGGLQVEEHQTATPSRSAFDFPMIL